MTETQKENEIKTEESIIVSTKNKVMKAAETVSLMANAIVNRARWLCILSFFSGLWLWFLFFHSLLFSLSPYVLIFLPILLILLAPAAFLYRFVLWLGELVELPALIRDKVTLTVDQAKKFSTLCTSTEEKSTPGKKKFKFFRSLEFLFNQIALLGEIKEISATVIQFFNPIQKIIVLVASISSIILIVLAGISFSAFFILVVIF